MQFVEINLADFTFFSKLLKLQIVRPKNYSCSK